MQSPVIPQTIEFNTCPICGGRDTHRYSCPIYMADRMAEKLTLEDMGFVFDARREN